MEFQLLDSEGCRLECRRGKRFEKSMGDRLVDADPPHVEALDGVPTVDLLAVAIISGCGVGALISDVQSATTVATHNQALQ